MKQFMYKKVMRYNLNAVCVCLVVDMNFYIIAFSEMKEYNKRKRQEYGGRALPLYFF